MNKNYLVVDPDGTEYIVYGEVPQRIDCDGLNYWLLYSVSIVCFIVLPKNSIVKLIDKELTWNDEPYIYD